MSHLALIIREAHQGEHHDGSRLRKFLFEEDQQLVISPMSTMNKIILGALIAFIVIVAVTTLIKSVLIDIKNFAAFWRSSIDQKPLWISVVLARSLYEQLVFRCQCPETALNRDRDTFKSRQAFGATKNRALVYSERWCKISQRYINSTWSKGLLGRKTHIKPVIECFSQRHVFQHRSKPTSQNVQKVFGLLDHTFRIARSFLIEARQDPTEPLPRPLQTRHLCG